MARKPKVGPSSRTVKIEPLSPETWEALAALFANETDPRWCWCQFWRTRSSQWGKRRASDNRRDLRTQSESAPAPGLVALEGRRAIGWVGVGPRDSYDRIRHSRKIPDLGGTGVWAINCFVVAKDARGERVASQLLAAAVAYAESNGASLVEGYPVDTDNQRWPAGAVFRGALPMFERAGFQVASSPDAATGSHATVLVVRRAATPPGR